MKAARCGSVILSAVFIAAFATIPADAGVWHGRTCNVYIKPTQNVYPPDLCCIDRIDILYPGEPEPGVFTDITLFPPFTSYETDGESYLYVFPSEPIATKGDTLPDFMPMTTFSTVLDWGAVGEPSPFTFVEYDTCGNQKSGTIYNISLAPTLSRWGLIVLTLLLLLAAAMIPHVRRRRALHRSHPT